MNDSDRDLPFEDVQAMTDASGLTLEDASAVVDALRVNGWELQPIPITPAERRRQRAADKKASKGFRI